MRNMLWTIGGVFHALGLHKLCNEAGALGNWPKGLGQDSYDWLWEGYDQTAGKVDVVYDTRSPSEGAYDQRTTGIGMGQLTQKASEDTSVTYRRPSEGFTAWAVYRDFDDGLSLTRNEVDDFPTNKVRDLMQGTVNTWGDALKRTEEIFGVKLFTEGGFTAGTNDWKNVIPGLLSQNTGGLAYDGTEFFNLTGNQRASKGGVTYFNSIAGLALGIAGYAKLHDRVFITNAKSERDEVIDTKGMGEILLLHPSQLRDEAFQTINSEHLPGTDFNDKNPWFNNSKPTEWRYLSDNPSTWYIGVAKKGIRFYRRGKPELRFFRNEDTGAYRATIRARMAFMGYDFRFWGGANVPTS